MTRFNGKVVMVTGAASGIGRATALRFARESARVAVCDLRTDAVQKVVDEIRLAGGIAEGYCMDVTQPEQIASTVAAIRQIHGRIDVLVNNAGIVQDAQLVKMTEEQFDQVIAINLKGVYNCAKGVVDTMILQGSGVILNASSVVALYGNFGQTNYAASKAGVIAFTKTWARELGKKGIRTAAVCPGFVSTPILENMPEKVLDGMKNRVPMKRLAEPEEIASVYAFLASDDASYINGAVISVDGGLVV